VKCIIDRQVVLSRAPEGPLVSHIGPFARSPSEQRYTLGSIQQSTSRLSEQPVEGTRRSEESQHMNTRLPKVLATSFVMLTLLGAAVSARAQAPPKYALQRTRKPHKGIGKRVLLARSMILRISSTRTVSTCSFVIFRLAG
jgi:hypothetical protein